MRRAILVAVALFCFVVAQSANPISCHAGEADANARVMENAAGSLTFSLPENRAYMLEKQAGGGSRVGVIFGYVDNKAACREIAEALTKTLFSGPFECHPIYPTDSLWQRWLYGP